MTDFPLSSAAIEKQLTLLAEQDEQVKHAIELVGFPAARQSQTQGFNTFLRVIIGQQISIKAAASIAARVDALLGDNAVPEHITTFSDEELRTCGLSGQKIKYVRSLCETVMKGDLDLTALPQMSDGDAIKAITTVKGLGVWSAHMYLMFSLGRADIWPVGDLGVRAGIGKLIDHPERPTEKELEKIGERWRPYRSVMALLAWHYYSNAPLL